MTKRQRKLWPITCAACGSGQIVPTRRAGRRARYRGLELAVPESVEIPTCDNCGTEWLDPESATAVDAALKEVYQDQLRDEASQLIADLARTIPQSRMERLLGLSQGYLSKVRSGTSTPSAMLVACLRLLRRDPAARIAELEPRRTGPATRRPTGSRKAPTDRSRPGSAKG